MRLRRNKPEIIMMKVIVTHHSRILRIQQLATTVIVTQGNTATTVATVVTRVVTTVVTTAVTTAATTAATAT